MNLFRVSFFGIEVSIWITFNEIRMHAWAGVVKVEGEPFHSLDIDYKVDQSIKDYGIIMKFVEIPRQRKCDSCSDGCIEEYVTRTC